MNDVQREPQERSSGNATRRFPLVMLASLMLLLLLLLFLGFQIANAPRGLDSTKDQNTSYEVHHQPSSHDPQSEKAWQERAESWKQMLKESSDTLRVGKNSVNEKSSAPAVPDPQRAPAPAAEDSSSGGELTGDWVVTDQGRKAAKVGLVVDTLSGTIRIGEPVEIVWSSPDGTVWKRVIDHPFTVEKTEDGSVQISVQPEEGEIIDSARLSGSVFAVPR